ncbi:MAG TPA: porin [Polyangiaceae bacterium]|nr:porin [Polyangiaceae bacterium]
MKPRQVGPGITFTPGDGVMIESEDKDFSVGLGFRFQLLYTLTGDDPTAKDTAQSLQVRRARAQVAGHAFGVHNKYRLEIAVSPSDVDTKDQVVRTSPLLEAYTEFDYLRDLTVRAGQFKVPFDRMRMTSDMARQLVDYSGVTSEFSLDRDIGVTLKSNDFLGLGMLRYQLGVFSGKGRNSFTGTDMGLLYIARAEVLPLGLYDDSPECDFQRTGPRLAIGGAAVRIVDARRDRGTVGNTPADVGGTTDFALFTGDVAFKMRGFSALGALYYRHGDRNAGKLVDAAGNTLTAPTATRDGTGIALQAGYLLPRLPVEIAARYGTIRGRGVTDHDALKDQDELGGGVNYFFAQHQLKLQADYFRIYRDHDLSAGYDQARLQLQLVM